MRKWENPEMNVFNVKMNENIAASGDATQEKYITGYIFYDLGGITRGGHNYRYNTSNQIQDTEITWTWSGNEKVVSKSNVDNISGCLA